MEKETLKKFTCLLSLFILLLTAPAFSADDLSHYKDEGKIVSDPIEPINRFFFQFNDKLYVYVLNPVAKGYAAILPEDIRMCIDNAFHNILTPVRFVNNLLQGKADQSGKELARFFINTTLGVAGFGDPAKDVFKIETIDEDLGQTLGTYGFGEGFYICWPIIGPSNLRDTIGLVGDTFMNPAFYIAMDNNKAGFAFQTIKKVNQTSLVLGEYEQFVESSFDPYTAMRDFYTQNRRSKIKDEDRGKDEVSDLLTPENANQQVIVSKVNDFTYDGFKTDQKRKNIDSPKEYYIQVGSYTDQDNVKNLVNELVALDKKPIVVKYQRPDYDFFGVMISGGQNFMSAKLTEQDLVEAGYKETIVVRQ